MTNEKRINEIREQLKALSGELCGLVAPTEDEIKTAADNYSSFHPDEPVYWMMLRDREVWVMQLHILLDVCNQREPEEDDKG